MPIHSSTSQVSTRSRHHERFSAFAEQSSVAQADEASSAQSSRRLSWPSLPAQEAVTSTIPRVERGCMVDSHGDACAAAARTVTTCRHRSEPHLRVWLPDPGRFAHVAIDLDLETGLFSLLCFRHGGNDALVLATAPHGRHRLRELEATLVEMSLTLPRALQRYFVAAVDDDHAELKKLAPRVRSMMCCQSRRLTAENVNNAVPA